MLQSAIQNIHPSQRKVKTYTHVVADAARESIKPFWKGSNTSKLTKIQNHSKSINTPGRKLRPPLDALITSEGKRAFVKYNSFIFYTSSKALVHVTLKISDIVDKREPTIHIWQMKKLRNWEVNGLSRAGKVAC